MRLQNDLSQVKVGDKLWLRRTSNRRLGGDDLEVPVVKAGPKWIVVKWHGRNFRFSREDGVAGDQYGHEMIAHKSYFDAIDELRSVHSELLELGVEFSFQRKHDYSTTTLRRVVELLRADREVTS